jgi:hypothetical protein
MTERELADLLDRTLSAIWRDLRNAFTVARSVLATDVLARLISERRVDAAVDAVQLVEVDNALARMQAQLVPVREASWQVVVDGLPRQFQSGPLLRVTLGAHALQEPTVLDAIRRADLARIQGISRETQEAVRAVLTDGIQRGMHPNVLAKQLRGLVGLTTRQAGDVARYRARLEAEGRKPDQVERMTAKYAQRRLNERTRNIAGTEVARAQGEARFAQTERLIANGTLKPEEWEQDWVTAADEIVCPICGPLHGVRTPLLGAFQTAVGPATVTPLHPGPCRCIIRIVPKGFRAGERPSPARDAALIRARELAARRRRGL